MLQKIPVEQFGKVEFIDFQHLVHRLGHLLCEINHVAQLGEIVFIDYETFFKKLP